MIITINKNDLKGDASEPQGCPLFKALKRQGYNVKRVGVFTTTISGEIYRLNPMYMSKICRAQGDRKDSVEVEIEGLKIITPKKQTFITRILNKLR